ncbi:hypothetical protein GMORB2_6982 [Geosmithia morbida]|uniref:Impact N-terminal domain-containing protein n=1 Tax=Geosmithia morbida TaxID=1094350 RepID=A0A9P5D4C9_9HYPO|nr:uncharacterized protein GMORB2_6982 [Geosmithia morbida]KAF4122675.1 hypothetical protein GMORB2_6982 [Geosmithia morbida]
MAGHGDLQELLRIFTSRRVPMMTAMKHVQALQLKSLKSIEQIAASPLADVETALGGDAKLAKSVHTACKTRGRSSRKRPADDGPGSSQGPSTSGGKHPRLELHRRNLDFESMSADELEESLALPPAEEDEGLIRATSVVTNRAPLLLAFAVELMRFTMPEQPPSSRLSLGQAVVSANSRSKAVSLGMDKSATGAARSLSEGQPRVRIMSREVAVLKRGGYTWSGGPRQQQQQQQQQQHQHEEEEETRKQANAAPQQQQQQQQQQIWKASGKVLSRGSTFIAHTAQLTSAGARPELMRTLMARKPEMETASHNAWAVRTRYGNSPLVQEASSDDGESGCGKFLLELMREADVANMLVVLTRWYGGVMLGPDRWRLMRECVIEALAAQRRTAGTLSGDEAVWALLDRGEDGNGGSPAGAPAMAGMAIHRPEGARNYLLRSFATATATEAAASTSPSSGEGDVEKGSTSKAMTTTKTAAAADEEKQVNLARVTGALRMLFSSWAGVLGPGELDRRAWSWYVAVRPDVDAGPAGWGAKGTLKLGKILDLRRPAKSGGE